MNPITVVGLGPAGADLILPAARTAISRIGARFVRTARHPAVEELARFGIEFTSFDAIYDAAPDLDTVYQRIVDALVSAAQEHDEVVYAVPGSPVVAERTVALLRERALPLTIIPGLSFADLAWARLGVDPLGSHTRVVDARAFAIDAAGAIGGMLIAQCDTRLLLGEVKLALLDALAADHAVTVLQRLGLPDERVATVALEDLDRIVEPDHLTSLYVDTGDADIAGEFARLLALTERLRGPGGCPWDAAQTHHSLARHTLEEAYEVVDAIETLPVDAPRGAEPAPGSYEALEEELGDLLFQVMIHSVLAAEAGAFTVADVASGVHAKLVHRHPHVFGDVVVDGADEVVRNWEQLKKAEKQHDSLVDGIPTTLPALLATPKLYRKMKAVGLDPAADDPRAWLRHAVARFANEESNVSASGDDAALGELLAACVAVARAEDLDPEAALRGFVSRMRADFRSLESEASARGIDLERADTATVRSLWARVRH